MEEGGGEILDDFFGVWGGFGVGRTRPQLGRAARAVGRAEPARPPSGSIALALEAARGPCAVRSRASRASEARGGGGTSSVCVAPLRDAAPAMCWH